MTARRLKESISEALWEVASSDENICSATLTGSFLKNDTMSGLSDIDYVVVTERLGQSDFDSLKERFGNAVQKVVARAGFDFQLNSTFGPLKFNRPNLVVLHLMIYTREGHRQHVLQSPFTCLDWQETGDSRKESLFEVFPSFALQPHHFLSSRRSISDYLRDYRKRVVSYRELAFDLDRRVENRCEKPMDNRDRHEFAYHVVRFLMVNLLKLVHRKDYTGGLDELLADYSTVFAAECNDAESLLRELAAKKSKIDYETSIEKLDERLERFVASFEEQFRREFLEGAEEHIFFRHAPTELNVGAKRFVGHVDPPVLHLRDADRESPYFSKLREAASSGRQRSLWTSPLRRCAETMQKLQLATGLTSEEVQCDERLIEIDYGACDGLTVEESKARFPNLQQAWSRGEDPCFPEGESSEQVRARVKSFLADLSDQGKGASLVCTHNVVLRCLVGDLLAVPTERQHLLNIPHEMPIRVVTTPNYGSFMQLDAESQAEVLVNFVSSRNNNKQKAPPKAA